MDKLIDLLSGYKKIKLFYYIRRRLNQITPAWYRHWYKNYLKTKFSDKSDLDYINTRINYYNKLHPNTVLNTSSIKIKDLTPGNSASVYYLDSIEYLRFFDKELKINTLFNDVIHVPDIPSLLKSRPINESNENSIVLNLNKIRHFLFIKDPISFSDKKNLMIGRGLLQDEKKLRIRFLEKHFKNPICDIGQTNDYRDNKWKVNFMPIYRQLEYKFILCWEGNDVASNLKYVMSSNSLAVTTKPKYETWFMEGTLIGGIHYVEIKDDFSDLNEKINYYLEHTEEAKKIIKNANAYTKQFQNKKREDLISILVLEKYFKNTNQLSYN
jgi:hypothetical protein